MRYSKFDEQTGMYTVYEDRSTHPLNGDLPVPALRGAVKNIGVSAREAGRPLPSGARKIGHSWHPQGVIVAAHPRGMLSGLGGVNDGALGLFWVGGGAIAGGLLGSVKDNVIGGIVAGGLLGAAGYHYKTGGGSRT